MIFKFDLIYDREPVLKWFEFEDGQVAKISKKHSQGLNKLKLFNKRSQYHHLDETVFSYHKQVIQEHEDFNSRISDFIKNQHLEIANMRKDLIEKKIDQSLDNI